ncbi:MAG: hypothetical protein ACLTH3_10900 [Lachnospira sp.]
MKKNVPHYMIGCINEIGGRQKADDVSGLLGESSLRSYLEDYYAAFPSGYLLRLGLDDFKEINEKFGTEYGDMVLKDRTVYFFLYQARSDALPDCRR